MKKAYVFVILVFTATAIASDDGEQVKGIELLRSARAQLKAKYHKRSDTCEAITCGKKGDKCDDNTACQELTECTDGICRQSAAGDACDDVKGCSSTTLHCDSGICKKIPKAGDKCDTTCSVGYENYFYCSSVDKVCKDPPKKNW